MRSHATQGILLLGVIATFCTASNFAFGTGRAAVDDCFCVCSDGVRCVQSVPNFLELKSATCQCANGVCPPGSEYNGDPCSGRSSWSIPELFRWFFYPVDYAENPLYNKDGSLQLLVWKK